MNTPRRRPPATPPSPIGRWIPAIAAVAVLAVVVVAGSSGGGGNKVSTDAEAAAAVTSTSGLPSTSGETGGYDVTGLTVPASTLPDVGTSSTLAPLVKTAFGRTLVSGVVGDDVKQLQARLTQLGFVPGNADGRFGEMTKEAVWAYEKLVLQTPSAKASGKVTNDMWQGMQDAIVIQPRRPGSGTHVEIYLPQQVAAVFTDNVATLVLHISSGTALTPDRTMDNSWCETVRVDTDADGNVLDPPEEKAVCGVSYTPGGVFRFQRQVSGDRVGALGRMFNPIYFNYGIAMHGAGNVPLAPASHGCIRMNKTISNTFQSFVHLRDFVYVWGQDGKEPEQYSKRETYPVFNYPDPNAVTTTSTTIKSTTTTAKPTPTTALLKAATTTTTKSTPTATTVKAVPSTTINPAATTVPTATTTATPVTVSP
jgi:hypothetical protein